MPTQKQPPQIRHLAAEKRGQFRVRAARPYKALWGAGNEDIKTEHSGPTTFAPGHGANGKEGTAMRFAVLAAIIALVLVLILSSSAR